LLIAGNLQFIASSWSRPEVYSDYWSEFTAPTICIEPLRSMIGAENLVMEGNRLVANLLGGQAADTEVGDALRRILPIALGT